MFRFAGVLAIAILVFCINFYPFVQEETPLFQNQVAILVYHQIDDSNPGLVTITSKLFKGQLQDLLQRNYHFIGLDQFKAFLSGSGSVPDNAVLVTFDDGYESYYTKAYPILHELHIPAVNFVITKDLQNPKGTSIPSLSSEEIQSMVLEDSGMEFQCHTDSLHQKIKDKALLTSRLLIDENPESDEHYETRILEDTYQCIRKLQALKATTVDVFAYPFGSYNGKCIELLKQSGIKYGLTTHNGMVTLDTDPMQVPRINAGSPFIRETSVNNLIIQTIHKPVKTVYDME